MYAERVEPAAGGMGSEANPIAAVLVFKDPPDWYRDTQLVLDVLTSGDHNVENAAKVDMDRKMGVLEHFVLTSAPRLNADDFFGARATDINLANPCRLFTHGKCTCSQLLKYGMLSREGLPAGGVPGREALPDGARPVQLYFANPDMLWANEFSTPRLGQGAFAACVQLLHREVGQTCQT